MSTLILLLGVSLIIVLLYLVLTDKPIPPAFKIVVLVAVALMFLVCILHSVGCHLPIGTPTTAHS